MGAKRAPYDATLRGGPTTVGATQTDVPVSQVFGIPSRGEAILLAVKCTGITNTSTNLTLQLQTSSMNDDASPAQPVWTDATSISSKPTTQAGVSVVEIRGGTWNSAQAAAFPLGLLGRLVCSTGASDSITVEAVTVLQAAH